MPTALARLRAALLCAALVLLVTCPAASAKVIRGTSAADRITGSDAADTIRGLRGADVIDGRGGADHVWGGAGKDTIVADGEDRVSGGAGADRVHVIANASSFRISCGPGRDLLTFTAAPGVSRAASVAQPATSGTRTATARIDRIITSQGSSFINDAPARSVSRLA